MLVEQLDQLGEICQRPGEAVDLVDNDDVNFPGADIVQQSLQVRSVSGPAGISPIVIARTDQGPAGMGLAFNVGGGGIILRVQWLNS